MEVESKRVEQLGLLLDVGRSIVSHRDLRELIGVISGYLRQVIDCDGIWMTLREAESGQLRVFALDPIFKDTAPAGEGQLVPMEGTPSAQVMQSLETVIVTRAMLENSPSPAARSVAAGGMQSGCIAPLISQGRAIGTLAMVSKRENAFSKEDAELFTQIAGQIAVAVDNALNFERAGAAERELARKLEHLRLMLKITNAVVSQLDLQELLQVISASICAALGNDSVGVGLFDRPSGQLRVFAADYPPGHPLREEGVLIPLEGSPSGLAFTSGQPVFLDTPDLERFPSPVVKRIHEQGYQSGGSIPLIAQGRRLGVLGVASKREAAFSAEDKDLLCQVANQVAIAVDNALNFERARKAEQEMTRQLERERLMLEINNAVVSYLSLPELLAAISESLRRVLPHDFAGLALHDDAEPGRLRVHARNQEILGTSDLIPLTGTGAGKAFTTRKTLRLRHINPARSSVEIVRRVVAIGFKSSCHAPLISHDRALGTLDVMSFREDAFSDEDVELLTRIANQIAIAVENALAYREIEALKNKLSEEKLYLEEELQTTWNSEQIIGASPGLQRILKEVETVAPTDSTVLIRGETGTGKELIARAIHNLSARRERTLVKLNCAAIPTGLLESELFGHEKGAFTGAIAQRIGRFELANKGTLFLDEVGDIPLELQPKLLRVLQEQEFERLGSARTQRVDVRLVAATNCDLEQMVAGKQFRGDLFYRLNVFPVTLPPLRERREDIPLLVRFFAQRFAQRMHKAIETISAEAMSALAQYHWPGNVRELENIIERAVILSRGPQLEVPLHEMKPADKLAGNSTPSGSLTLAANEREHILRVLEETKWVVSGPTGAAARLGMKRTTLQARMQKLGITRQR
jgi:formate hydrogenlyase transcriptional activator